MSEDIVIDARSDSDKNGQMTERPETPKTPASNHPWVETCQSTDVHHRQARGGQKIQTCKRVEICQPYARTPPPRTRWPRKIGYVLQRRKQMDMCYTKWGKRQCSRTKGAAEQRVPQTLKIRYVPSDDPDESVKGCVRHDVYIVGG